MKEKQTHENFYKKEASYIIEIAEKLKSQQMMTDNPIAAQIKLTEMLKALNNSH